jgi:hypothetical protein
MARDFTITAISSSNGDYVKINNAPYIPFILSIPGPISIHDKGQPYDIKTNK